jgi:hypothetical protein
VNWARYEKKQPGIAAFLLRQHPFFNDGPELVPKVKVYSETVLSL